MIGKKRLWEIVLCLFIPDKLLRKQAARSQLWLIVTPDRLVCFDSRYQEIDLDKIFK